LQFGALRIDKNQPESGNKKIKASDQ